MKRIVPILCAAALLAGGCAAPQPVARPMTAPRSALAPQPVVRTAGSLWSDQTDSPVIDRKANRVGDILTVAIFEQASASREATTSTGRQSSASADITKLLGLESKFAKLNSAIDPSSLLSSEYKGDFNGSGSTSRKEDLVATLTTRVVEVLPNGNLKIEGAKTVTVNNEDQFIQLSGEVRPSDISPGNLIDSKYVLDARIAYTGKGVISENQKPGWLLRAFNIAWPF